MQHKTGGIPQIILFFLQDTSCKQGVAFKFIKLWRFFLS